ncbi:protein kinase [Candidatus Uabimicrobium amorphum]|uniref:Protein kinase n=1 Tax=Uabimicrobium amorphum TaxID=2596890 RepID=A0A5S9IRM4_UABAM|nr:protein kinase [Candidatus Uabimicrobium amorphum]
MKRSDSNSSLLLSITLFFHNLFFYCFKLFYTIYLRLSQWAWTDRDKFLAESLASAYLEHPNIVPIHDIQQNDNDEILLAMKLVKGTSWKQLLYPKTEEEKEKAKKYSQQTHLQILVNVCNAISYAHSKGIVHCDLKPENIMIGDFGEIYVMDWGIAVDVTDNIDDKRTFHKSSITEPMGTPCYMSPELAEGRGQDISYATDIYLLGGILYEILHKKPPRKEKSLWLTLLAAKKGKMPVFDRAIPEELIKICQQALAKNATQRPQNVNSFRIAIEDYFKHYESIIITQKAEKILEKCTDKKARGMKKTQLYEMYTKAITGFEQAINLWQENENAQKSLLKAHNLYTKSAIANDDFGIAKTQIEHLHETKERKALQKKISKKEAVKFGISIVVKFAQFGILSIFILMSSIIIAPFFVNVKDIENIDYLMIPLTVMICFVTKSTEEAIKAKTQHTANIWINTIISSFLCYICVGVSPIWASKYSILLGKYSTVLFWIATITFYIFMMLLYSRTWIKVSFSKRLSIVLTQIGPLISFITILVLFEIISNVFTISILQSKIIMLVITTLFSSIGAGKTVEFIVKCKQPWWKQVLFIIPMVLSVAIFCAALTICFVLLVSATGGEGAQAILALTVIFGGPLIGILSIIIFYNLYFRIYNVWPKKYRFKEKFWMMLYHVFVFFSLQAFYLTGIFLFSTKGKALLQSIKNYF